MKSLTNYSIALTCLVALAASQYVNDKLPEICTTNIQQCQTACYCQDKSEPKINTCDEEFLTYRCLCNSGYEPSTRNTTFSAYDATCRFTAEKCREKAESGNGASSFDKCETTLQKCLVSTLTDGRCQVNKDQDNKTNSGNSSKPVTTKTPSIYDSSSGASVLDFFYSSAILAAAGVAVFSF